MERNRGSNPAPKSEINSTHAAFLSRIKISPSRKKDTDIYNIEHKCAQNHSLFTVCFCVSLKNLHGHFNIFTHLPSSAPSMNQPVAMHIRIAIVTRRDEKEREYAGAREREKGGICIGCSERMLKREATKTRRGRISGDHGPALGFVASFMCHSVHSTNTTANASVCLQLGAFIFGRRAERVWRWRSCVHTRPYVCIYTYTYIHV